MDLVLRLINGKRWRDKWALKLVVALDAEVRKLTWLNVVTIVRSRLKYGTIMSSCALASLLILSRADYVEEVRESFAVACNPISVISEW